MTDLSSSTAPLQPARSPRFSLYAAPLLLLAVSVVVFFIPLLGGANDVPGDMGDGRFNLYLLEHVYRWLTGLDRSLLSLPIFFPYPYTLGFSDTHAGSAIFYAAFRFIGWNQYDAFKAWVVVGYVLTFLAAYYVLLRLSLPPFLAALGAFAFAFSLPAIVQIGHSQLTYRVAVPFALYYAMRYAEAKKPATLCALIFWNSWQILINIYLGFFTLLISAVIFIVSLCVLHPAAKGWLRDTTRQLREPLARVRNYKIGPALGALIFFIAALAMLAFYGFVSWLYGFGRSWPEILTMVPRIWSYFILDDLPYWASISKSLPAVPMRNEQELFLGVPVTVLFIAATVYTFVRHISASASLRIFAYSSLATGVVMTKLGPVVLYWIVAQLPGFDALRAVSRYQLVGAFPIMVAGLLFFHQAKLAEPWKFVATCVMALWVVSDVNMIQKLSFSSQESRDRISAIVAQIDQKSVRPDSVLAYGGDPKVPPYINQIDAMFAAAQLRLPTLNGYSGNSVPGYDLTPSCSAFLRQLSMYDSWAVAHHQLRLDAVWHQPLELVLGQCDLSREAALASPFTVGPAPDADSAKSISLGTATIKREGADIVVNVPIHNGTSQTLHSMSANPVHLSWRFPTPAEPTPGWDPRVDIGADLASGATRGVTISIDGAGHSAGDRLQVTFVVEGKFWAHDIGIGPIDLVVP